MSNRNAIAKTNAVIIVVVIIIAAVGVAYYYSTVSSPTPAAITTIVGKTSAVTTSPKPLKNVRYLYPVTPQPSFIPVVAMQKMGYLAAEGINVSISQVAATPFAVRALIAGSADLSGLSADGTISSIAAGGKLKAIVAWGLYPPYLAVTTSDIKTWQDLVGKKIGVSGLGGLDQELWIGTLAAQKISTDDVHFVNIGLGPPDRMKGLIAGSIDAALVLRENWVLVANTTQAQNLHVFLPTLKQIYPFWPVNILAATDSYIQRNPDVVQGFTNALIKITRDFYQNKTIFFVALDKAFPGQYNDRAKEYFWDAYVNGGYFAVNGGLNFSNLSHMINYTYKVLNPKAAGNPYIRGPGDLVDTTFLKHTLDQMNVFSVNGKVASWDIPDWYLGSASKAPASKPTTAPASPTRPSPSSGYIERILIR